MAGSNNQSLLALNIAVSGTEKLDALAKRLDSVNRSVRGTDRRQLEIVATTNLGNSKAQMRALGAETAKLSASLQKQERLQQRASEGTAASVDKQRKQVEQYRQTLDKAKSNIQRGGLLQATIKGKGSADVRRLVGNSRGEQYLAGMVNKIQDAMDLDPDAARQVLSHQFANRLKGLSRATVRDYLTAFGHTEDLKALAGSKSTAKILDQPIVSVPPGKKFAGVREPLTIPKAALDPYLKLVQQFESTGQVDEQEFKRVLRGLGSGIGGNTGLTKAIGNVSDLRRELFERLGLIPSGTPKGQALGAYQVQAPPEFSAAATLLTQLDKLEDVVRTEQTNVKDAQRELAARERRVAEQHKTEARAERAKATAGKSAVISTGTGAERVTVSLPTAPVGGAMGGQPLTATERRIYNKAPVASPRRKKTSTEKVLNEFITTTENEKEAQAEREKAAAAVNRSRRRTRKGGRGGAAATPLGVFDPFTALALSAKTGFPGLFDFDKSPALKAFGRKPQGPVVSGKIQMAGRVLDYIGKNASLLDDFYINAQQVASNLGVSGNKAQKAINYLRDQGVLRTVPGQGRKLFFQGLSPGLLSGFQDPTGLGAGEFARGLVKPGFDTEAGREGRVLKSLINEGRLTTGQLARATGLTRGEVGKSLLGLQETGFVDVQKKISKRGAVKVVSAQAGSLGEFLTDLESGKYDFSRGTQVNRLISGLASGGVLDPGEATRLSRATIRDIPRHRAALGAFKGFGLNEEESLDALARARLIPTDPSKGRLRGRKELFKTLATSQGLSTVLGKDVGRTGILGTLIDTGRSTATTGKIRDFGAALRTLTQYASAASIIYGVIGALRQAVTVGLQFEQTFARIQAVLPGRSLAERFQLQDTALATARKYAVSLLDVAESAKIFAQQGLNASEVATALDATFAAVQGANLNPQQAREFLTAIRNITTDPATGEVGIGYFEILDRISRIESRRAIDASSLADALKAAAPLAKQFEGSFVGTIDALDLVNGIVTQIVQQTRVSGKNAATSLRFILARLGRPAVLKQLESLGAVRLAEAGSQGKRLRPLIEILDEVSLAYARLRKNSAESTKFLVALAGARQVNAAAVLLDRYRSALQTAALGSLAFGDTQLRTAVALNTTQAQLVRLRNEVNALGVTTLSSETAFGGLVREVVGGTATVLGWLNELGAGGTTKLTLFGVAVWGLVKAFQALRGVSLVGLGAAGAAAALGTTALSGGFTGAQTIVSQGLVQPGVIALPQKAVGRAFGGAARVTGGAVGALLGSPTTATILALLALGTAAMGAYQLWGRVVKSRRRSTTAIDFLPDDAFTTEKVPALRRLEDTRGTFINSLVAGGEDEQDLRRSISTRRFISVGTEALLDARREVIRRFNAARPAGTEALNFEDILVLPEGTGVGRAAATLERMNTVIDTLRGSSEKLREELLDTFLVGIDKRIPGFSKFIDTLATDKIGKFSDGADLSNARIQILLGLMRDLSFVVGGARYARFTQFTQSVESYAKELAPQFDKSLQSLNEKISGAFTLSVLKRGQIDQFLTREGFLKAGPGTGLGRLFQELPKETQQILGTFGKTPEAQATFDQVVRDFDVLSPGTEFNASRLLGEFAVRERARLAADEEAQKEFTKIVVGGLVKRFDPESELRLLDYPADESRVAAGITEFFSFVDEQFALALADIQGRSALLGSDFATLVSLTGGAGEFTLSDQIFKAIAKIEDPLDTWLREFYTVQEGLEITAQAAKDFGFSFDLVTERLNATITAATEFRKIPLVYADSALKAAQKLSQVQLAITGLNLGGFGVELSSTGIGEEAQTAAGDKAEQSITLQLQSAKDDAEATLSYFESRLKDINTETLGKSLSAFVTDVGGADGPLAQSSRQLLAFYEQFKENQEKLFGDDTPITNAEALKAVLLEQAGVLQGINRILLERVRANKDQLLSRQKNAALLEFESGVFKQVYESGIAQAKALLGVEESLVKVRTAGSKVALLGYQLESQARLSTLEKETELELLALDIAKERKMLIAGGENDELKFAALETRLLLETRGLDIKYKQIDANREELLLAQWLAEVQAEALKQSETNFTARTAGLRSVLSDYERLTSGGVFEEVFGTAGQAFVTRQVDVLFERLFNQTDGVLGGVSRAIGAAGEGNEVYNSISAAFSSGSLEAYNQIVSALGTIGTGTSVIISSSRRGTLTELSPTKLTDVVTNASVVFDTVDVAVEGMRGSLQWAESRGNPLAGVERAGRTRGTADPVTAEGLYQFTDSTWNSTLQQMDPAWARGLSSQQRIALKQDPEKQEEAYRYLMRQIATATQRRGDPLSAELLDLSWFQGENTASQIYSAAQGGAVDRPLSSFFSPRKWAKVKKDNPGIGDTVGSLLAYQRTHRFPPAHPGDSQVLRQRVTPSTQPTPTVTPLTAQRLLDSGSLTATQLLNSGMSLEQVLDLRQPQATPTGPNRSTSLPAAESFRPTFGPLRSGYVAGPTPFYKFAEALSRGNFFPPVLAPKVTAPTGFAIPEAPQFPTGLDLSAFETPAFVPALASSQNLKFMESFNSLTQGDELGDFLKLRYGGTQKGLATAADAQKLANKKALINALATTGGSLGGGALGDLVGSKTGGATGGQIGTLVGGIAGLVGPLAGLAAANPLIGGALILGGGLLGGLLGGIFGGEEEPSLKQLEIIARNTGESLDLIENTNKLLEPTQVSLNLPTRFSLPSFSPTNFRGVGAGDTTVNVTVNGAGGDAREVGQEVASAVTKALSRQYASSGAYYATR